MLFSNLLLKTFENPVSCAMGASLGVGSGFVCRFGLRFGTVPGCVAGLGFQVRFGSVSRLCFGAAGPVCFQCRRKAIGTNSSLIHVMNKRLLTENGVGGVVVERLCGVVFGGLVLGVGFSEVVWRDRAWEDLA